jgi:hypothetical protein
MYLCRVYENNGRCQRPDRGWCEQEGPRGASEPYASLAGDRPNPMTIRATHITIASEKPRESHAGFDLAPHLDEISAFPRRSRETWLGVSLGGRCPPAAESLAQVALQNSTLKRSTNLDKMVSRAHAPASATV